MARLYHEREEERLHRGKGTEEERYGNELERSAEDQRAHKEGIPKRKPRRVHVDTVRDANKPKSGEDGNGIGERGAQGGKPRTLSAHILLQSHSSVCAASTPIAWSVE